MFFYFLLTNSVILVEDILIKVVNAKQSTILLLNIKFEPLWYGSFCSYNGVYSLILDLKACEF